MTGKKTYESKRSKMTVSFNKEKEAALLELAKTFDFSGWVKEQLEIKMRAPNENTSPKQLIREDMNK